MTIQDIAQDEQLTVNYGKGYWHHRNINPIDLNS